MTTKEKFAQKMLEEKLDFLPLKESIELHKSSITLKTKFSWVIHNEELEDNGYGKTTEEILKEFDEIYGLDDTTHLRVGDAHNQFDEFTLELCPAPTYIDLIK